MSDTSPPSVLIISPHLDDAAFSCAEPMHQFRCAGWQVDVATLFTATVEHPTGFALACQTDKGIASDVDYMSLRRKEDQKFMQQLDLDFHHMDLAEAPHRGYGSAAELFSTVHEDDSAFEQCERVLGQLLKELRPDVCIGPLGVGGHVDHRVVITSLERALLNSDTQTCLFYADQPYALKHPKEIDELSSALEKGTRLHFRSDYTTRHEAINATAAYTTQLDFQFGGEQQMRKTQEAMMASGTYLWHQGAWLDALEQFLVPHSPSRSDSLTHHART